LADWRRKSKTYQQRACASRATTISTRLGWPRYGSPLTKLVGRSAISAMSLKQNHCSSPMPRSRDHQRPNITTEGAGADSTIGSRTASSNPMTTSSSDEFASEQIEPARQIFEVETIDVVADKGYFKSEDIEACEKAGLTPRVPRPQRGTSVREAFFRKDEFRFDAGRDAYICPAGQTPSIFHTVWLIFAPILTYRLSRRLGQVDVCLRCRVGQPTRTKVSSGPLSANSYMPQGVSRGSPIVSPANAAAVPSTSSR
jgi:hypothetical protein